MQKLLSVLALALTLSFSHTTLAASACKGKAENLCGKDNSCYWVSGYTRTNGTNVKAHCRTKSKANQAKADPSKAGLGRDNGKKAQKSASKSDPKATQGSTKSAAKKTTDQ